MESGKMKACHKSGRLERVCMTDTIALWLSIISILIGFLAGMSFSEYYGTLTDIKHGVITYINTPQTTSTMIYYECGPMGCVQK